jgi:hypothetical protein
MSGVCPRTRQRSLTDSSPDDFVLTLWTNDVSLASTADRAGVQRIGVDLDRLGKAERQRGRGTWISPHQERDLEPLGRVLTRAELFARVDPLNGDTARQVDAVIAYGARAAKDAAAGSSGMLRRILTLAAVSRPSARASTTVALWLSGRGPDRVPPRRIGRA